MCLSTQASMIGSRVIPFRKNAVAKNFEELAGGDGRASATWRAARGDSQGERPHPRGAFGIERDPPVGDQPDRTRRRQPDRCDVASARRRARASGGTRSQPRRVARPELATPTEGSARLRWARSTLHRTTQTGALEEDALECDEDRDRDDRGDRERREEHVQLDLALHRRQAHRERLDRRIRQHE
jgi:hypothetical protein